MRAESRTHDSVSRLVEIGVAHDQRRILAAHFDDQRPRHEPRGVVAHQLEPDLFRSGEDDPVDAFVIDQLLTDSRTRPRDEVEDTRRQSRFNHHLGQLRPKERRIARGLEDHRIAGGKRSSRRSSCECKRKIERRNDSPHAIGSQHADVFFAGAQRSHFLDEPAVLLDLFAVVGDEIRSFFDVADAFESIFSDFVSHQSGQRETMGADGIGDSLHVRKSLLPRQSSPLGIRRARSGHRSFHVLARALLKAPEDDAGVNRAAILELRVGFEMFAVDEEQMFAVERLRGGGDGGVEFAMELFERVAAKRCVRDFGGHGSVRPAPSLNRSNLLLPGAGTRSFRRRS